MKTTTSDKSNSYDAIMPLLQSMFREFQDLSKKKPEGVLSKTKIDVVNRLLVDVLFLLEGQPTRQFLDLIDGDGVPQYSDVVLMLGQAEAAMRRFRSEHHGSSIYNHGWHIED
ncbi:hypothetical protein D3C72_1663120 [compost metagenome]